MGGLCLERLAQVFKPIIIHYPTHLTALACTWRALSLNLCTCWSLAYRCISLHIAYPARRISCSVLWSLNPTCTVSVPGLKSGLVDKDRPTMTMTTLSLFWVLRRQRGKLEWDPLCWCSNSTDLHSDLCLCRDKRQSWAIYNKPLDCCTVFITNLSAHTRRQIVHMLCLA